MSLTDEDKHWISGQFERLLDVKLQGVNARPDALDVKIEALDAKIERVETSLLTEFHKWASPAEMRARSHAAALRAMDLEIEAVADR